MSISITQQDKECHVKVTEDLTVFYASEYHQELLEKANLTNKLVIDLSELEEMDTSGVQLLLSIEKQLQESGGEVLFNSLSEEANKTLSLYNLINHFNIKREAL